MRKIISAIASFYLTTYVLRVLIHAIKHHETPWQVLPNVVVVAFRALTAFLAVQFHPAGTPYPVTIMFPHGSSYNHLPPKKVLCNYPRNKL